MPFVAIRTAGAPLSRAQTDALVQGATALMANVMGKSAALTSVRIEEGSAAAWGIGGAAVEAAAHMDVFVTEKTNTAEEMAAMVERGHALLQDVLGPLPEATYVVVHPLAAHTWGYAGRTQASRRLDG